jgi:hypothetical protein
VPQIIFRHPGLDVWTLAAIGHDLRKLVAEAASTPALTFDPEKDIDFLPVRLEEGSMCPQLAIEIRTIGFPERKAKMDRGCILALKEAVLQISQFPADLLKENEGLIWVQFVDPDGVHV